jgi:hypothetical protein
MGAKLFNPELTVLKYEYDFSVNPQSGVGAVNLGNLPDEFVVQSVRCKVVGTLTATTTIALGEDGGGDADGYLQAVDPAATQRGNGALVYDATAGDDHFIEHVVDATKDGIVLTTAVAAAIAGKVIVYFQGYQH